MNQNSTAPSRVQFIGILDSVLNDRQLARPTYSLRDFARDLSVDSSALSRILRGKQIPSLALAATMVERLELSTELRRAFFLSIGRVRLHGLVDSLSTYLEPPVDTGSILKELVSEPSSNDPNGSLGFDLEKYRSLVALLPGYAAVFSVSGALLLRNDLAASAGLFEATNRAWETWHASASSGMSFDQEFDIQVAASAEKTELRFSAIRGSDNLILGWLATSNEARKDALKSPVRAAKS